MQISHQRSEEKTRFFLQFSISAQNQKNVESKFLIEHCLKILFRLGKDGRNDNLGVLVRIIIIKLAEP